MKTRVAGYYAETKQKIFEHIVRGSLVHADETRASIKGKTGFVCALASNSEVVYILADSREGEKERFERNRDGLFTFLSHDGVPWDNNNAEHAIKAFARLRDVIAGSSTDKGLEEYLTLLSLCQNCKYMGVDLLDFLRSGEKDIHAFADSRRSD